MAGYRLLSYVHLHRSPMRVAPSPRIAKSSSGPSQCYTMVGGPDPPTKSAPLLGGPWLSSPPRARTRPTIGQRGLPGQAAQGHRTVTCIYKTAVPVVDGEKQPWELPDASCSSCAQAALMASQEESVLSSQGSVNATT